MGICFGGFIGVIVFATMTLMNSGHHPQWLAVAGFEPVGGGQGHGVFGQHSRQACQDVGEVFLGIDAQATAVFYDGVEDGAFLTGHFIANEQPVFGSEFGRTDGVFDEVVADFYPAVAQIGSEVGPLVDGIADGFAEFAFGQDGGAEGEFSDDFFEPTMDHAAFGGAHGSAQGGTGFGFAKAFFDIIEVGELAQDPANETRRLLGGFEKFPPHVGVTAHEFDPWFVLGPRWIDDVAIALDDAQQGEEFGINGFFSFCGFDGFGFLEESDHAFGVASIMPMIEDGSTGYVRGPEVAGLGFAAAGLEVSDRGFVDLSVKRSPMFILDFSIDDREPVGGELGPVAEGFAVEVDSHAGKHFGLPIVGQVADEAVVDDLGNEARGGDAAVLEGGGKWIDEGLGSGVVFENEFAAHELDAEKFGGFVVELFADFFTDAAVVFGVEQDFGGIELLADDGKVLGNTGGAGLAGGLLVIGDYSRRGGCFGSVSDGRFLADAAREEKFELCGIKLLTGFTEDAAAEGVDLLFEDGNLVGLTCDDLVALGDLVEQVLYFAAVHLL